jgi:hypothetical protein
MHSLGNVYIADFENNCVRKVTASTGIITTFAGNGTVFGYSGDNGQATSAELCLPNDVTLDASGTSINCNHPYISCRNVTHSVTFSLLGNVYIADSGNYRIRKVTVSTGIITTIAGTGIQSYSGDNGPATSAALYYPWGVALDATGR